MINTTKEYKSIGINFHQTEEGYKERRYILSAELDAYQSGASRWQFEIFDCIARKHVWVGDMTALIEKVLAKETTKQEALMHATFEDIIQIARNSDNQSR